MLPSAKKASESPVKRLQLQNVYLNSWWCHRWRRGGGKECSGRGGGRECPGRGSWKECSKRGGWKECPGEGENVGGVRGRGEGWKEYGEGQLEGVPREGWLEEVLGEGV